VKRTLVALALLVSLPALAQMELEGGGGMPNPREMSGRSRPDEKVTAGTAIVKVVRGDMSSSAVGIPVVLVGMSASGESTKQVLPTGLDGRVTFEGLQNDGSTAYYAFCLLDGDRLISEAISPSRMAGTRLLLAGRKQGAEKLIDDEMEGSDQTLPPGEVRLIVRGNVTAANTRVVLREVGTENTVAGNVQPQTSSERLTVVFTGVPGGVERPYVGQVTIAGKTFHSQPFVLSETAGVARGMLAHDELLFGIQGGGQLEEGKLWFEVSFALLNVSSRPYRPSEEGVLLPVPDGSIEVRVANAEELGNAVKVTDEGIRWVGVVPPGEKTVTVQFSIPIEDRTVHFTLPAPLGIFQSQLAVEHTPGSRLLVITPDVKVKEAWSDGRRYDMLSDLTIFPGKTLEFDVTRLPERPKMQLVARVAVGMMVLILVVGALTLALVHRAKAPTVAGNDRRRRELEAERERLYEELAALERTLHTEGGPFRAPDSETQRKVLVTRLILVLKELDGLAANPPARGP
jgi:hypothetical protein